MDAQGSGSAIRSAVHVASATRLIDVTPVAPPLVHRPAVAMPAAPPRRTKIWEFNTNLHCSIIGTCLSTGELRQFLKKLGVAPASATDHELHGIAVTLAARHDEAARQINKALDRAHKLPVAQFSRATTEDEVRALWQTALAQGDIPGAYWAALTHPASTRAMIREAFGDVHMLSHLVGSANRADIRRLRKLEADNADLMAKLELQQGAMHDAVSSRDAQISELRETLAQRTCAAAVPSEEAVALRSQIADLQRRLDVETGRRVSLEDKLCAANAILAQEQAARMAAERSVDTLQSDVDAIEASLAVIEDGRPDQAAATLTGVVVLYVGGRPNHLPRLRAVAERLGATLLHHDGGVESHPTLLPGLVSRSDLVVFPVDCISHDAALMVKALCRNSSKRFIPLRSASMASLLTALHQPDRIGLSEAAD